MNIKEFFKPTLEKIIIFLIIFTFFPWPRQIYITPRFYTSFLFYGPIRVAEILSVPLELGHHFGSTAIMFSTLFSPVMRSIFLNLLLVVILSYLLSCLISLKTNFLKPTKIKVILSFVSLFIFFIAPLVLFLSRGIYNEKAMAINILLPLVIFSFFYLIYSSFQKHPIISTIVSTIVLIIIASLIVYFVVLPNLPKKMPQSAFDNSCSVDDDCVLTRVVYDKNNCCHSCGYEAVNKKAASFRESWQLKNCQGVTWSSCPMFNCALSWVKPVCRDQKCLSIPVSEITDCKENDNCIYYLATEIKKDIEICKEIKNELQAKSCFDYFDIKKCDLIDDFVGKYQCKARIAGIYKDPSLCSDDNIDDIQNSCLWSVAQDLKDPSICEMRQTKTGCTIGDLISCISLVASSNKEPQICEKLDDVWQLTCERDRDKGMSDYCRSRFNDYCEQTVYGENRFKIRKAECIIDSAAKIEDCNEIIKIDFILFNEDSENWYLVKDCQNQFK